MRQSPWLMVGCPTCLAGKGERCYVWNTENTHYAIKPHVARVKLAKQQFRPSGEGYARVR